MSNDFQASSKSRKFFFSVQNMHDKYSPKILTVFRRKTDGKWSAFHLVVESLLIGWLTLTAPKV